MNWKQFRDEVEKRGIKDDQEIGHIDYWGYEYPEDLDVEIIKDLLEVH